MKKLTAILLVIGLLLTVPVAVAAEPTDPVKDMEQQIAKLPSIEDVTFMWRIMVYQIKETWDTLTPEQQQQVLGNEHFSAVLRRVVELEYQVVSVELLIALIPPVEQLTLLDEAKVTTALVYYQNLDLDQKAAVRNADKLFAADKRMDELRGLWEKWPIYGDVNLDGQVDAVDALWLLRATVGKEELWGQQLIHGDVNGDTKTDASDALLVLKFAVKRITRFPVEDLPVNE